MMGARRAVPLLTLTVLLAACSPGTPVSAVTVTAKAAVTAKATAAAMPPGCASALAALPAEAPATETQTADDSVALGGRKGTTAGMLADSLAADALNIGFAFATGTGMTAAVGQWTADAAALRSYCSPAAG